MLRDDELEVSNLALSIFRFILRFFGIKYGRATGIHGLLFAWNVITFSWSQMLGKYVAGFGAIGRANDSCFLHFVQQARCSRVADFESSLQQRCARLT